MTNNSDDSSNQLSEHLKNSSANLNSNQIVKKVFTSVNRTSVDFDKTDVGDECFRLIKVSQKGEGVPVTLSSDSPDLYQIAIGVKKLVFEDRLTFTPTEGGTFVHIRFRPDRMGNHSGSLILETTNDQQVISLSGKGGSFIATPASEQIAGLSPIWKWAAIVVLVSSIGYAGYTYRCQLAPDLCNQPDVTPSVSTQPAIVIPTEKATNNESETIPAEPTKEIKRKEELRPATSVVKPEKQSRESQAPPRNESSQERKVGATVTPKQESKPVLKTPSTSEESELERELNKKPGN